MKFCDKLVKLRKSKGLSQEELANELGVSRQAVFKYESGENMPELDNIKKIAKVFNVSFDLLLDDDKDIEEVNKESEPIVVVKEETPKPINYRNIFNSGIKIDTFKQADYEHGYVEDKKATDKDVFIEYSNRHNELIKTKGYTKTIRIQKDVLCDFFMDDNKKTFGFFYDGAPQFVCPYENLAAFSMGDSGLTKQHGKTTVVGVGFGSTPGIGVGSIPTTQTGQPNSYDLNISYFDENGVLKDYKISFKCSRVYIVNDFKLDNYDKLYAIEDAISESTRKGLSEVAVYLNAIKETATQVKNGLVQVTPIDAVPLTAEVKKGQEEKKKRKDEYAKFLEAKKKFINKVLIILLIIVFVIIAISVTTCSISNAVKENQIAENNKNKSQEVMDNINDIGEVTLESESKITKAENSYNALTEEQKKLVTNYSTLEQAKSRYSTLLDAKLEEDTKDDPSRTIVVDDLNGHWMDQNYRDWYISDHGTIKAVLMQSGIVVSGTPNSSYVVGYTAKTRRMNLKLYLFGMTKEYLDVSMTKSASGELTLYYGSRTFKKVK